MEANIKSKVDSWLTGNYDQEAKNHIQSLLDQGKTDELTDTVDYVFLNRIIKEEMCEASRLLETVARRILDRIFTEDTLVKKATVLISKINPPIGGDVEKVTIKMTDKRKN